MKWKITLSNLINGIIHLNWLLSLDHYFSVLFFLSSIILFFWKSYCIRLITLFLPCIVFSMMFVLSNDYYYDKIHRPRYIPPSILNLLTDSDYYMHFKLQFICSSCTGLMAWIIYLYFIHSCDNHPFMWCTKAISFKSLWSL